MTKVKGGQQPNLELPLGKRSLYYRFFEILPGFLSWLVIFLPFILSFINTTLAAIFILLFVMAWFYRAIGITYLTVRGFKIMQKSIEIDWWQYLEDLRKPEAAISRYYEKRLNDKHINEHYQALLGYVGRVERLCPEDITHAIIIPMYNESFNIVESTLLSILDSKYDMQRVMIIIAYEERGGEELKTTVKQLLNKYKSNFLYMNAVKHPAQMPGEVIGKGGNITYAGRFLQRYLVKQKIEPGKVIVTTLDADNRLNPMYLASVSYKFITTPERRYRSFQPIALYINNIWDAPAPIRVLATGNSFWTILQSVRPHLLRNFSSHSQGMDSLIDMDFWSTRTIVEDGHQFWRSYFHYDGNYEVIPIHIPIYQDAVLSDTYRKTLIAQFIQFRRWSYGVSDIPFIGVRGFSRHRRVSFWDFFFKFLRLVEGHVSQATISLILLFAARVPLLVGHNADKSIVAHQLPLIVSYTATIALLGVVTSIYLFIKTLPPRPAEYRKGRTALMLLQWVLIPFISIIYGSIASLYSQTRLMLGKYLDKFDVTEKITRSSRIIRS